MNENHLGQCKFCNKLVMPSNLKAHISLHHAIIKRNCKKCSKYFNSSKSYENHLKICRLSKKSLKCERCKFSTKFEIDFIKHKNQHEKSDKKISDGENWMQCKKCPAVLKTRSNLQNHYKIVHPKRQFSCDVCGVKINSKFNLNTHLIKMHFIALREKFERNSKMYQTLVMLGKNKN